MKKNPHNTGYKLFPGQLIKVSDKDDIDAFFGKGYFDKWEAEREKLVRPQDRDLLYEDRIKARQEKLEKDWRSLGVSDEKEIPNSISEPVKLTITRSAFDNCGDYKKGILRQVSKRAAVREFEQPQGAYQQAIVDTPTTVIWHFSSEEFLKITKEYPWLLDSNLGEMVEP